MWLVVMYTYSPEYRRYTELVALSPANATMSSHLQERDLSIAGMYIQECCDVLAPITPRNYLSILYVELRARC